MSQSPRSWLSMLTCRGVACAAVWLAIVGTSAASERLFQVADAPPVLDASRSPLPGESAPAGDVQLASVTLDGKPLSAAAFDRLSPSGRGEDQDAVIMTAGPPAYGADPQEQWTWQVLPGSLIYHSYLAGVKEPRFASVFNYDKYEGWIWDIALGGRVGLLRYGSQDCLRPQGWQFDMEGAVFPRLDLETKEDLMAADFRAGAPLTYGQGDYQMKFAMYHLSSHLGDEFMLRNPTIARNNYSRNVLVWGHSYYMDAWRIYGEAGWAFDCDVGKEWEFQAGLEYSPVRTSAPFAALNLHSREEVDFGGNVVLQAGWQWRAACRLFRVGVQYYDGKSEQFEFYTRTEQKVGVGLWYDY